MVYRAIGLMSGSSLDGLDVVFTELEEHGGNWGYNILAADCYSYNEIWKQRLANATTLNAYDYCLLHTEFGKLQGELVNRFIATHALEHKVQLIASHGHTVFHAPAKGMTAQLGDGAALAAATGINVVDNLRAMDVALGGEGAPIIPMGEKLLLKEYSLFLNIGGIANISLNADTYIAFDVCPANRVLNLLAERKGMEYDKDGILAAGGVMHHPLLQLLNNLDYYKRAHPKSLDNSYGINTILPIIDSAEEITVEDALMTYCEHICVQVENAIENIASPVTAGTKMLVTGGGALNTYLVERLKQHLQFLDVEVVVPDENLVKYKEALVMALLGVLRWREQNTVLASVTGAKRDSIGGSVWMGQEA